MTTLRRVAGQPTWLISRAHARAQRLLFDAFAAHGARGYQFRILAALEQHGPSSQADLGRATGIDRSDVVTTLDELVGDDYARRDPDPRDRRRNVVSITPAGKTRLERLDDVLGQVQQEVLAPLTPSERARFLLLVEKLV